MGRLTFDPGLLQDLSVAAGEEDVSAVAGEEDDEPAAAWVHDACAAAEGPAESGVAGAGAGVRTHSAAAEGRKRHAAKCLGEKAVGRDAETLD